MFHRKNHRKKLPQYGLVRRHRRRGVAPVEFIPFLPIFTVFLLFLLWVARVRLSEMQAGLSAAEQVQSSIASYEDSGDLPQEGRWEEFDAPELRDLLHAFAPNVELTSGGVNFVARVDSGGGVPLAIDAAAPAVDFNERMINSWEADVFAFPAEPNQQPQLTLPDGVLGIAPELDDLAAFTALLDFSSSSLSARRIAFSGLGSQAAESVSLIRESIASVEQSMRTISERINELRAAEFPDEMQIKALEQKRTELEIQLEQLKQGQEMLSRAQRHYQLLTSPREHSDD